MTRSPPTTSPVIRWLMLALFVWGGWLAVGAARQGRNLPDGLQRGGIVLGCVLAFLGAWAVILWARKRRGTPGLSRNQQAADPQPPDHASQGTP